MTNSKSLYYWKASPSIGDNPQNLCPWSSYQNFQGPSQVGNPSADLSVCNRVYLLQEIFTAYITLEGALQIL